MFSSNWSFDQSHQSWSDWSKDQLVKKRSELGCLFKRSLSCHCVQHTDKYDSMLQLVGIVLTLSLPVFSVLWCGVLQWNTTPRRWEKTMSWRMRTLSSWWKSKKTPDCLIFSSQEIVCCSWRPLSNISTRTSVSCGSQFYFGIWKTEKKKYECPCCVYLSFMPTCDSLNPSKSIILESQKYQINTVNMTYGIAFYFTSCHWVYALKDAL